jgi:hypothetical protein
MVSISSLGQMEILRMDFFMVGELRAEAALLFKGYCDRGSEDEIR